MTANVVIATASTAPAYSLATLGFIVAVAGVGLSAPAVVVVSRSLSGSAGCWRAVAMLVFDASVRRSIVRSTDGRAHRRAARSMA